MQDWAKYLPHVNASLNALATLFLVTGYLHIRARRERSHRTAMMAAFATSVAFLICYVVYHTLQPSKRFPAYPPDLIRVTYYVVLVTHVVLAATVPLLAVLAIYFGWKDNRPKHRKVVRWALPIWLYVSVSGIVVYLMLYQLFPPQAAGL